MSKVPPHHLHPICPKCGKPMRLKYASMDVFPYLHTDFFYECCGKEYAFGVPADPLAGMALIIWHDKPEEAIKFAKKLGEKTCPFCKIKMKITKIAKLSETQTFVQWKCPNCYYAEHYPPKKAVPREIKT